MEFLDAPPEEELKPKGIINIDEFVFDILLIAGALFFRQTVIPPGNTIIDILTPGVLLPLLFLVCFTVTMVYGQLNRRYQTLTREKSFPRKIILILFIIISVYSVGSILSIFGKVAFRFIGESTFLLCNLFFLPITGIIGGVYGHIEDSEIKKVFTGIIALTFSAVLGLFIVLKVHPVIHNLINRFVSEQFQGTAGYIVLIVLIALLIVSYVLMWPVYQKIFEAMIKDDRPRWRTIREILKHLLESALLIGGLFIIQEIMITWGIQESVRKTGPEFSIVPLFFFGIIPIRVLTLFAPPVRVINLIMGIGSAGLYIYMLINYLPVLQGLFR
jgi:hypothetical protein